MQLVTTELFSFKNICIQSSHKRRVLAVLLQEAYTQTIPLIGRTYARNVSRCCGILHGSSRGYMPHVKIASGTTVNNASAYV